MKKICRQISSMLLCGTIISNCLSTAATNIEGAVSEKRTIQFVDVSENDWFYDSVYACHESGIFMGDDANQFHPLEKITVEESYAILARLHQRSVGDDSILIAAEAKHWSDPYLAYCLRNNILSQAEANGYTVLNRELFALFLSRIYDLSLFEKINDIADIVDYETTSDLGKIILNFYQSGIFGGINIYGSFSPLTELSRAECATIITRLLYPEKRIVFTKSASPFKMKLSSDLETVYDFDGKYIYQVALSDKGNSTYYVTDLYGRKIASGADRISRIHDGVISYYDNTVDKTFFHNVFGTLIYQSSNFLDYGFRYGKLAINQNDGSILIIDTQGDIINCFDYEGAYRVIGASFGEYIPVVPNENRNYNHSYWLDANTGVVTELPYTVAYVLNNAQDFIMVKAYNESNGSYTYNAIDTSLKTTFPQPMKSVQTVGTNIVVAEDDTNYYVSQSGKTICSYSKEQQGKIEQFSTSNRILQYTAKGETQVSNLKTGEIYALFPEVDTYLIVGKKITRPRNVDGITVIDLFDEHGNIEQEGIQVGNIWYGDMGQILYCVDNQYFYISG